MIYDIKELIICLLISIEIIANIWWPFFNMENFFGIQRKWRKWMEQGIVEVDEIDLEFCLFHVFIVFLPCGFSDVEYTNF
jgi:hypothetical protein